MKIIHTADWHLGKNLEGRSRIEEQKLFLQEFVQIVEREQADIILIAGDIYDTGNPSSAAEGLFYDALKQLSSHGERMILVIAGNHDNPQRLMAAGPLAKEHGILICGLPKTVITPGCYGKNEVIASGEGYVEVCVNGERAVILTLAYPSEKRLNEVIYSGMEDDAEQALSYGERIRCWFSQLERYYREDTVNLAVSHLFVMGSGESGSERGISLGNSYLIPTDCLPEKAQYTALGHVHKPQVVPGSHGKAYYAGSPMPYHRKEAVFKDGTPVKRLVYSIEVYPGRQASIREVLLTCYKPVEVWRCRGVETAKELCRKEMNQEKWIYLEIETDSWISDEDIRVIKEYQPGVLQIHPIRKNRKLEKQDWIKKEEKSLEQLFTEYFESEKGMKPERELVDLLMEIAGEES